MDIACPNCAATYRVPDSLLARGIALRCASCDHAWVPDVPQPLVEASAPEPEGVAPAEAPPPPPPAAPEAPQPEPAPPPAMGEAPRPARHVPPTTPPPLQRRDGARQLRTRPERPARRRLAWALPLAWAASVTLVVFMLAGLVVFGEEIAQAWPPFARVTSLLHGSGG